MTLLATVCLALRPAPHDSSFAGDNGASLLSPSSGDSVHCFPGDQRWRGPARPLPRPAALHPRRAPALRLRSAGDAPRLCPRSSGDSRAWLDARARRPSAATRGHGGPGGGAARPAVGLPSISRWPASAPSSPATAAAFLWPAMAPYPPTTATGRRVRWRASGQAHHVKSPTVPHIQH
jgi:hypothetical protein